MEKFSPEKLNEFLSLIQQLTICFKSVLTVEEAAEFLDLKVSTIYKLTAKSFIPHYKREKKIYFKKIELELWMTEIKCKTFNEIENELETTN